ncbi:N-glycosylase/DNA lyase [Candidatus Bathyarchaeota archaeon]|nr:N-glycosylase/DNA lyase [Candidatus Bathyarchaeota archaeon]MBS7631255.1 N-glycosylase/DNA lyase [Candidatus Bathyarchaeota archaeon]
MSETKRGEELLISEILKLSKDPKIKNLVDQRVSEFLEIHEADSRKWFIELVYCILTANSSAEKGQLCVDGLDRCDYILNGSLSEVLNELQRFGHRFAAKRAEYIIEARKYSKNLKEIIQSFKTSSEARVWLSENVKGLGFKESSHFLRNVGYLDLAILDRHVISNMVEFGLIMPEKRSLTKKRYLEHEKILKRVAERVKMHVGELDLYLWYRKTGKVLK